MGTQSSYGGPGDKTPLLPDWALQTPTPPAEPDAEGDQDAPAAPDETAKPNTPLPTAPAIEVKPPQLWKAAKGRLGSVARGGNRKESLPKAARGYVKALGGSRRAARSSAAGRSATASLGAFLGGVASAGLDSTLRALRLTAFVGKDAETVFAAVINAICPEGVSKEEVAARESVSEALWQLYGSLIPDDGNLDALNSLSDAVIQTTIVSSVAVYIYRRWLGDLGIKIEENAISAKEAIKLERQMKTYIRDSVKLELGDRSALNIDWKGKEGRELVEGIYRDAFSLIGGAS